MFLPRGKGFLAEESDELSEAKGVPGGNGYGFCGSMCFGGFEPLCFREYEPGRRLEYSVE